MSVTEDTFPDLWVNNTLSSDWKYVRETANHYSNGPVTNVTDPEFRCYELDLVNTASQTGTATVVAGSTVGFHSDASMGHPGYFDVYMTPAVPAANSEAAGTGKTWFKIWEWSPTWSKSTGLVFASENIWQFNFTIPKSLPSGQYLIRGEQIALHVAESYGGAQFYIGCAQVNVINGGTGKPGPLVSIPGVYTGYEPGILINIYNLPANYTGYQAPGPAVWTG
ncbi:glycoside hydrolase family 61 protein D [Sistotremastrum suecicum HHB10207 ss-3]|uniref:lytic cellulose monooxygenase (C4-dehydrogenating) n=1 Tax=Sistotremastrum suecicum HHB10207 ss-3 TaxID=1314776 RepID=A0A166B0T0_9AGAM|nr:glycoside hydrolase family 61 protein D [Sistotremastrum suecicum HHB10207 ss-3]